MAKPLSKVLYFLGILDDTDIEWMVRMGRKRSVPAGSVVIQEGEPIDSLFIILGGEFKVTSKATGDAEIARLNQGEILGEISFVDMRSPSATVTAVTDSTVGVVPREALERKMAEDPAFATRFYKSLAVLLSDRLRTSSRHLGYGEETSARDEDDDANDVPPHLMDIIFMAGTRFAQLQVRAWGS
jgi:CRP/FNR family transcriptional regulator, cyclic AMP receptor protein